MKMIMENNFMKIVKYVYIVVKNVLEFVEVINLVGCYILCFFMFVVCNCQNVRVFNDLMMEVSL